MTLADGQKLGDRSLWKDRVPPSADVFIEGFELFDGFTAIEERSGGVKRLRTLAANGKSDFVASDEPAYAMALGKNAEPDTEWLRYEYTSLTTPAQTYAVNIATGQLKLLTRSDERRVGNECVRT